MSGLGTVPKPELIEKGTVPVSITRGWPHAYRLTEASASISSMFSVSRLAKVPSGCDSSS